MSNKKKTHKPEKVGFTARFVFERETKNAIRYEEVGSTYDDTSIAAGDRGKIETLYVRKSAFNGKYPKHLIVRVRSAKHDANRNNELEV